MVMILLYRDFLLDGLQPADVGVGAVLSDWLNRLEQRTHDHGSEE